MLRGMSRPYGFNFLFLVAVACVIGASHLSGQGLRVACIGDSITEGAGIPSRSKNSYPAQLGKLLGQKYEVRNFGLGGRTMSRRSALPYWDERFFIKAQQWQPQIVVIMLGTNDANPRHWRDRDEFIRDYGEMIDTFARLSSKPKVFVCLVVPVHGAEDSREVRERISLEINPAIQKMAEEKKLPLIDLYRPFLGKPELFPDTVHPNQEGAALIAAEVSKAIRE